MNFSFLKIKIISWHRLFRYIYYLLFVLTLVVFILLGFFLYDYVYQSIAQSDEIILKKKEIAPEIIDVNKVRSVIAIIDQKNKPAEISWEKIKNPFATLSLPTESQEVAAASSTPKQ